MSSVSYQLISVLTDVVQADPVGGVHFLFDVPGDDQVTVAQSQLVRRRCER